MKAPAPTIMYGEGCFFRVGEGRFLLSLVGPEVEFDTY